MCVYGRVKEVILGHCVQWFPLDLIYIMVELSLAEFSNFRFALLDPVKIPGKIHSEQCMVGEIGKQSTVTALVICLFRTKKMSRV